MTFKSPFDGGKPAAWVRDLAGKSGVYVIRAAGIGGETFYVGESHSGRLYGTLLRHFQHWKGETAGPTYDPAKCVVGVKITPAENALEEQNDAIQFFWPRDNTTGNPRRL